MNNVSYRCSPKKFQSFKISSIAHMIKSPAGNLYNKTYRNTGITGRFIWVSTWSIFFLLYMVRPMFALHYASLEARYVISVTGMKDCISLFCNFILNFKSWSPWSESNKYMIDCAHRSSEIGLTDYFAQRLMASLLFMYSIINQWATKWTFISCKY